MELGGAGLGPASLLTRPSVIRARPVATGPVSAPHITPGHHQPDSAGGNILYRKLSSSGSNENVKSKLGPEIGSEMA